MAYADDTATFVKWVKVWEEELKNAVSATENTQTNTSALTADMETLSEQGKATVAAVSVQRRQAQQGIASQARAQVMPILAQIGRTIDSPTVVGDTIDDLAEFFRNWRTFQNGATDEKVNARDVTHAAEPSFTASGNFYRLTIGPEGTGDVIESGRHATTQTIRVEKKPTVWETQFSFVGTDGALDALNYTAAPRTALSALTAVNEVSDNGTVTNPNMTGGLNTVTNDAAITTMSGWTLATSAGSPSLLIETTSAKLWRSRTVVFSISGASSTKTFTQDIPANVLDNRYQPVLPVAPFYLNTGWAGTITLTWGDSSQAFTEADLTAGDWRALAVDRDQDLYPNNFDQADANWQLSIATGAGAGSNELVFAGFWAIKLTKYNDFWYGVFSDDSEAVLGATVTFADTQTNAGEIQDTLDFAFQDEGIGAYLMTAGTNTLNDPA